MRFITRITSMSSARIVTSPLLRSAFASRSFSLSSTLHIKEGADRNPEELDKIKREQIDKQKKGEGHWHEELASEGESNIAADKENVDDHGKHMEDLQKQTAGQVEKNHPEGKAKD
ncbi:hypothetical protein LTR66_004174 [Elasticomyces elasticus]|nr:hypothetical protein LTR66_004174 [Elasticomyces elasticus]